MQGISTKRRRGHERGGVRGAGDAAGARRTGPSRGLGNCGARLIARVGGAGGVERAGKPWVGSRIWGGVSVACHGRAGAEQKEEASGEAASGDVVGGGIEANENCRAGRASRDGCESVDARDGAAPIHCGIVRVMRG